FADSRKSLAVQQDFQPVGEHLLELAVHRLELVRGIRSTRIESIDQSGSAGEQALIRKSVSPALALGERQYFVEAQLVAHIVRQIHLTSRHASCRHDLTNRAPSETYGKCPVRGDAGSKKAGRGQSLTVAR